MLDIRDYYLNNDDDMETLIIDYLHNKKKQRERQTNAASVQNTAFLELAKGWPHYRDVDIPGFYNRSEITEACATEASDGGLADAGLRNRYGRKLPGGELLGGISKALLGIIKAVLDEELLGRDRTGDTGFLKYIVDTVLDKAKRHISELQSITPPESDKPGLENALLRELVENLVSQEMEMS